MTDMTLYDFLSGAVACGFLICGLLFLRFWRRTREQLFLAFSLAFVLLGAAQTILALAGIPTEERGPVYLVRLAAFLLILLAIYWKNRKARA